MPEEQTEEKSKDKPEAMPESTSDFKYTFYTFHVFESQSEEATFEWEPRSIQGRGKIIIGEQHISEDRLDKGDIEQVPAGVRPKVHDMRAGYRKE